MTTMAPEWDVRLEAEGHLGVDAMDDLLERLAPYGAVGSPGDERVSVRLTVEAEDAREALTRAAEVARPAGFRGRIVAVEAEEVQE